MTRVLHTEIEKCKECPYYRYIDCPYASMKFSHCVLTGDDTPLEGMNMHCPLPKKED